MVKEASENSCLKKKKGSIESGGIEYCSHVPKHGHREANMQVSNALWWPRGTQQAQTAPSHENPSNSQGSSPSLGEGQWNAAPCPALTTARPRLYREGGAGTICNGSKIDADERFPQPCKYHLPPPLAEQLSTSPPFIPHH